MKRTLSCVVVLVSGLMATTAAEGINDAIRLQIEALHAEKAARTPAQQKMDSQLVYAAKRGRNEPIAAGVNLRKVGAEIDGTGRLEVDIDGKITAGLIDFITVSGGTVKASVPQFGSVRAEIPLALAEVLAARADVRFIRPAVRAELEVGALTSQGVRTHLADTAGMVFGVNGTGVKVGVLSDSVDFLAASQASGDVPATVTVLPGQSGVPGTGEGTAMLEIIHDMAPGAELFFATAGGGPATFAQNILNLRALGCDVIVDDIRYQNETPFQDGIIARAVNAVTADGAVYFASAGNSGNKLDDTSGTWEGDFVDGGAAGAPVNGRGGRVHSFGATTFNTATAQGGFVTLYWADPLGASTNDYDLFLLDANGNNVVASSTTTQNGSQDPYEIMFGALPNERIVVVKVSGDARFLHIDSGRGRLQINTDGFGRGHSAATNAFATAAVDVAPSFPQGFSPQSVTETFSSDGPRRVFFHEDGRPITPGNFLSTGGAVRQYPTIAAADGVTTTVPGFDPFFGTSAAAPHGAGSAALVKSFNLAFTRDEIWQLLTNTALDIELPGVDNVSGFGIVRPYRALLAALPQTLTLAKQSLSGGNENGSIDPNECNLLSLIFTNRNAANTTSAVGIATLVVSNSGIAVNPMSFVLPAVPGGAAYVLPPVRITTLPGFVCGTPVDFTLIITNQNGTGLTRTQFGYRSGFVPPNPILLNNSSIIPIADNDPAGVESVVNVSGISSGLGRVSVSFRIAHPQVSDLTLQLIGPDGTTVNLIQNRGFFGSDFGTSCTPLTARTTLDDNAPSSIIVGTAPFVGSYRPEQPLSGFAGRSGTAVNGTWRLRVTDGALNNVGAIQCWTLSLYPAVCAEGDGPCVSDLEIEATAVPAPALSGQDLTYSVNVRNSRSISATNVVLTNHLPPGVMFVSATASQGGCQLTNNTILCDFGVLASSSNATATIVVQPNFIGTLSNAFVIGSAEPDANPSNNVAVVLSEVVQPLPAFVSAGVQVVAEGFAPATGGIESGETVTLAIALRNSGTAASGNLLATLQAGNGVASPSGPQSYGSVAVGDTETRFFSFTAPGAPGSSINAVLALQDGANNLGTLTFSFTVGGEIVFANAAPIVINTLGTASPYPATINVSGLQGVIAKVRATFVKLGHTYPDDIDALLVGPGGQKLLLMSDAGGGNAITDSTITFDSGAAGLLPNETTIGAGTYRPTDYVSGTETSGDLFPAPAPVGSLSSSLSAFNSTDPNGTWSLFIHDDGGNDNGVVAGGWSLTINTVQPVNPVSDLEITSSISPAPLAGEPFTITLNILNRGPSNAASVVVTNILPGGMESTSALSSQGSVSINGGVLVAALGNITNGGSATVWILLQPNSLGLRSNVATVASAANDLNSANNTATSAFTVNAPVAEAGLRVTAAPATIFVSSNITFTATITNAGPNHAEAVVLTNRLAAGLTFISATGSQGGCSFSAGVLTCNVGDISANGSATVTLVARADSPGSVANLFALTSDFADSVPANDTTNVVTTIVPLAPVVVASGAAVTGENPGPANGALDSGESVTMSLGLRNAGTAPTANLVATLLPSGGVSSPSGAQNYGALAANGPTVARPFSFVVSGAPGTIVTATLQLQDGAQNLGTATFNFTVSASRSFTNSNVIIIPNNGQAATYPSTLTVSGITGSVSKVTVSIRQLTHSFPEDVDMLLVGPAGQKVLLMSDAGAGNGINGVTLTLDDSAAPIPFANTIASGTYRPTDYAPGDTFPAPAPGAPYGTNLFAFNGTNPNGVWSLYVFDDAVGDAGRIDGGWALNIQTASPIANAADVAVIASAPANVASGEPFTYNITVANYGPGTATGVTLLDPLPASFVLTGATISQGSFSTTASNVTANFGTLNAGASATMTISGAAVGPRNLTNVISVSASQPDPNLANNTASAVTTMAAPVLAIRRSGSNAVVTWRAPSTGYTFESSLNATGIWAAAGLPILNVSGTNTVTVPATNTKYFRLRQ